MARKPSNSPEDDLFSGKVKPYEEALADLKEAIERHVKQGVKCRHKTAEHPLPTRYKFIARGDE